MRRFERYVLEETTLYGETLRPGEKVGLLYASGNRDPRRFERPDTLDLTRDPNPHLTFGGNGPHYCIGANLAKLQIELIFNAIADHMPDITSMGDATRLRSGWLNAIQDWKVDFKCPVIH